MNNEILVVGSVALDTIKTPFGDAKEVLGGSAVYFSIAASSFSKVNIVGVVGNDFPDKYIKLLKKRKIDVTGLVKQSGKTFRWTGEYKYDLNQRETLDLQLNVFKDFNPEIPDVYKNIKYIFLANIDPELQLNVLKQVKNPKLVACDTMDHWIKDKKDKVCEVLSKVDIIVINDSEARQFSGSANLVKSARKIQECGPKVVIIKKGEHGAFCFSKNWHFASPAFPLESVYDPTGAGDSFAGGFMGYLASCDRFSEKEVKQAIIFGTVTASYCVENFSVRRLQTINFQDIKKRYNELKKITHFEPI